MNPNTPEKHSPLPWFELQHSEVIRDKNGVFVADVRRTEDRKLIVQLANSHAHLLEENRKLMEDDWTGSVIDRLNSFVRENSNFSEVKNGSEACDLICLIHGKYNRLKSDNRHLLEANRRLVEACIAGFTVLNSFDDLNKESPEMKALDLMESALTFAKSQP